MSKKQLTYTQCVLNKEITKEDGVRTVTLTLVDQVWIPSQFAIVGKRISLKKEDGWDNGWVVKEKGNVRTAEWLDAHNRDWLTQRRASDAVRKDGHWEKVT